VLKTHRFRAPKAFAFISLVAALLALPSPLTGTSRVSAATFSGTTGTYINEKISWICACSVDATKPPALSSFDVRVDGVSNPVATFTVFGSAILDVTLTSPVYSGSVITFSYNAPAVDNTLANNAFQRSNGEDYASFTLTITNMGRPRPVSTTTPPLVVGSTTPSWDTDPVTEAETDAFTEGFWPSAIPGNIIITDQFGFTVDKKNGIKPKIRMKDYAGKIKMTISATYKDGAKTKKYKCTYAPFGSSKKVKTAKWKWYTPKKACILPKALVTALQTGTTTLNAKGSWPRIWVTSGKKARPDKTKIKARTLKYTVRAKPAAAK
jgi:hypothetical protein